MLTLKINSIPLTFYIVAPRSDNHKGLSLSGATIEGEMLMKEVYMEPGEDLQSHMHEEWGRGFLFPGGLRRLSFEGVQCSGSDTGDRFIILARVECYLRNVGSTPICLGVKELPLRP